MFENLLKEQFQQFGNILNEMMSSIPVNIIKNEKEYIIQTTLQSKEYVSIDTNENKLRLCVNYPYNNTDYYIKEINNGCRSFYLQAGDITRAKAEMVNHLLQIRVPISANTTGRRIEIE